MLVRALAGFLPEEFSNLESESAAPRTPERFIGVTRSVLERSARPQLAALRSLVEETRNATLSRILSNIEGVKTNVKGVENPDLIAMAAFLRLKALEFAVCVVCFENAVGSGSGAGAGLAGFNSTWEKCKTDRAVINKNFFVSEDLMRVWTGDSTEKKLVENLSGFVWVVALVLGAEKESRAAALFAISAQNARDASKTKCADLVSRNPLKFLVRARNERVLGALLLARRLDVFAHVPRRLCCLTTTQFDDVIAAHKITETDVARLLCRVLPDRVDGVSLHRKFPGAPLARSVVFFLFPNWIPIWIDQNWPRARADRARLAKLGEAPQPKIAKTDALKILAHVLAESSPDKDG